METCTVDDGKWIHLGGPTMNEKDGGKSFSRLLYPNPVCFLCVSHRDHDSATSQNEEGDNVMVVSWLSATNNKGKFVMSLNKRRHTAQLLYDQFYPMRSIDHDAVMGEKVGDDLDDDSPPQGNEGLTDASSRRRTVSFTLCVPVAGMEDLVLAVGGTSGRTASKFQGCSNDKVNPTRAVDTAAEVRPPQDPVSNRERKSQRRAMLAKGIPDLKKTRYGRAGITSSSQDVGCMSTVVGTPADCHPSTGATHFCIHGTVAHLLCTVDTIWSQDEKEGTNRVELNNVGSTYIDSGEIVDSEHYLISSTVIDAYCHEDYWDTTKRIFRPLHQDTKPYLTFFGSQSFGHITLPL